MRLSEFVMLSATGLRAEAYEVACHSVTGSLRLLGMPWSPGGLGG